MFFTYYLEEFLVLLGVGAAVALPIKLLKKRPWWWGVFLAFFIAYCLIAFFEIVRPFESFGAPGATNRLAFNLIPFVEGFDRDAIENIVCALPFGFLLPLVFDRFRFKNALLAGAGFGLLMELSQLALYFIHGRFSLRVIDVTDVICNFLGTVLGWCLFAVVTLLVYWLHGRGVDCSLFRYIKERDIK